MTRTRATNTLTIRAAGRSPRPRSRPTVEAGTRRDDGHDQLRAGSSSPPTTALPAEALIARLAQTPDVGSVELGYGHRLLFATLTELTEERFMRDVIACSWAAHLGVNDTPDANASICFAALADVVGRLIAVAEAIHRCLDADWVVDPDAVALGYAPPNAPVAAVSLVPRDVRLALRTRDKATRRQDQARGSIWLALDPLIRAWCHDGDLDVDSTSRTLG